MNSLADKEFPLISELFNVVINVITLKFILLICEIS